eukprot:scaffold518_cov388-Prasinococcus_capsulatus_cf.AAC.10
MAMAAPVVATQASSIGHAVVDVLRRTGLSLRGHSATTLGVRLLIIRPQHRRGLRGTVAPLERVARPASVVMIIIIIIAPKHPVKPSQFHSFPKSTSRATRGAEKARMHVRT